MNIKRAFYKFRIFRFLFLLRHFGGGELVSGSCIRSLVYWFQVKTAGSRQKTKAFIRMLNSFVVSAQCVEPMEYFGNISEIYNLTFKSCSKYLIWNTLSQRTEKDNGF